MTMVSDYKYKPFLEVSIIDGAINITEEDLTRATKAQLRWLRISRAELKRCFYEGVEMMKRWQPRDRVRPCADQKLDGTWVVNVVGYSVHSDPLMPVRRGRNTHVH
jgi:hypothetical protein